MRALIQRVKNATVKVERNKVGIIDAGILVFLGIKENDSEKEIKYIADKIINLRIFKDINNKMNLSLLETKRELMIVSQFTLYGNCDKGRRPSFDEAARPDRAECIYERFIEYIRSEYDIRVETGIFGASMEVELLNDGPVTFFLESR